MFRKGSAFEAQRWKPAGQVQVGGAGDGPVSVDEPDLSGAVSYDAGHDGSGAVSYDAGHDGSGAVSYDAGHDGSGAAPDAYAYDAEANTHP